LRFPGTYQEPGARMLPLCAARIEDLGQGDFVKVDCAACLQSPCSRRTSSSASGSALTPRCSTSNSGSGAGDAEREGGRWFRSSGRRGAGEPASSAGPRQAIETTPIVPAGSIGSTPGHRAQRRGGPVRRVCAFWVVSTGIATVRRARHPSRPRTAKHRGGNGTSATVAAPKPQEYVADRSPISAGHPRSTRAARLRASPPARQAERHSRTVLTLRCTAPDSPSQAVSRISSRRVPEESE